MTGLGEILEENSRLRDFVRERDARLDAQSEQLRVQAALIAELDQKLAAVQASNDQFKRYQEFIEKRNELAARLEGIDLTNARRLKRWNPGNSLVDAPGPG